MNHVFRKVSLERLSSPEQLDLLMQLTDVKSWLTFLGLASLLAAAVFWGFTGNIPIEMSASAVLIHTGGIKNIVTTEPGQVTAVYVQPGELVSEGQVIADVMTPGQDESQPVYSLLNGRILEIKTAVGDTLERGETLANLEFVGEGIQPEAVLYLSPAQSRTLAVGMPVTIQLLTGSGSTAPLTGTVLSISNYPVSQDAILQLLGSEELAQNAVQSDTPIEVRIAIQGEVAQSGIPASATILIGNQRPIDLVIPLR